MQEYTYNWLHIPTGKRGQRTYACPSELQFYVFLNWSNAIAPGIWQYWY